MDAQYQLPVYQTWQVNTESLISWHWHGNLYSLNNFCSKDTHRSRTALQVSSPAVLTWFRCCWKHQCTLMCSCWHTGGALHCICLQDSWSRRSCWAGKRWRPFPAWYCQRRYLWRWTGCWSPKCRFLQRCNSASDWQWQLSCQGHHLSRQCHLSCQCQPRSCHGRPQL